MRLQIAILSLVAFAGGAYAAAPMEDYKKVPMPPGFHVEATELDGPVFADAKGHTLYQWPFKALRNGITGDPKGKSLCEDVVSQTNAGYMSPYPGGLIIPDVETRPSCTQAWPPVLAAADAKPVGAWTIIARKDGTKQWAYDEHPLYTSHLDSAPGDVIGATSHSGRGGEHAAVRKPVGPPNNLPPGFEVVSSNNGRLLVTAQGNASVYVSDKDTATKSMCDVTCTIIWKPVIAPEFAQPTGEWTILERSPGVKQWAFRKKPLYTNITDNREQSLEGSDEPGWHNVFLTEAPPPPKEFTTSDTTAGTVLADKNGKTIYLYICGDDAVDQLACDHPGSTQAFRFALAGGGDPVRANQRFPMVPAPKDAKPTSRSWTPIDIDPMTGKRGKAGDPGVLHVWAYRDRPVYTFAKDEPGDYEAEGLGEFKGTRQGYRAFWLRDDFYGRMN